MCIYTCDEFFPPTHFTHYQITLSELIFGMTEPMAALTCRYRSHLRNIKYNCQFVT